MNRKQGLPSRTSQLPPRPPPRYVGSSSGTKNVPLRLDEKNELLNKTIPRNLDFISPVKELYKLSSTDVSKLIAYAENGIIKWTKTDGSTLEINVETLARYLARHIIVYRSTFKLDEENLRYLLSGVRLLHMLCDIASHSPKLNQVLFDDVYVGKEILDLIFSMMTYLSNLRTKIQGWSEMALLYSSLLASSLYLLTSFISSEYNIITPVLLAHPKVDQFTDGGLTSVGVVISFLQVNLSAYNANIRLNSKLDKVYCLFQTCEASLQFFQALCKQRKFREHLELRDENVVLQLVHDILKLPQCKDSHLMEVVYRIKSKVLFIMLCLCEVENSTFLGLSSNTTRSLELAFTILYEVLKVVKMMFNGDFKDHPQGLLSLNAMRITEIFSDDSNFRSYIVLNLTEVLTKVFTLPEDIFLSSWCSSDPEPPERDIVRDYDSLEVSRQALDVYLATPSKKPTLSAFSALKISYARQRSALLVKTVANLSCIVPGLSEDENGHFVREFLECLRKKISNLPDAVADGGGEIIASLSRNLRSFSLYAESLIPQNLNIKDVNLFRLFYRQVEQGPKIHRAKEVDKPTPQRSSPDKNDVATEDERTNVAEKKRKRHKMNHVQISMIDSAVRDDPDLQKKPDELRLWADKLSLHGLEVTLYQLKNWLNNRRAKHARATAKDLRTPSQVNNISTEKQSNSPRSPVTEFISPSSSTPGVLRICGPESSQIITVSTPAKFFKRGQNVTLTNEQGEETGNGCIHLANGTWFGKNIRGKLSVKGKGL